MTISQQDEKRPESPETALTYSKTGFWLLAVALIAFVLIFCGVPHPEFDLFWQLRTGRDMIAQHAVPHIDPYSWTRPNHVWVVHEWLALLLFWGAYSALPNFLGLFLIKSIVASITILIFFSYLCRSLGYRLIPVTFLAALAVVCASIGFDVRPQLFTYLFLTIVASALLTSRYESDGQKKQWWLVPVFILWANIHSGVIVGLLMLTAWCVGDYIDGINKDDAEEGKRLKKRALSLAPVLAACFAGTLVTPYGIAEYADFAATLGNSNVINAVSEWASPTLHDTAGQTFCILAGVLLAGMLFARRFVAMGDVIIFALLVHSSLTSYRNIPLFALVGTMIAARYLASLLPAPTTTRSEGDQPAAGSLFGPNAELPAVVIAAVGLIFIGLTTSMNSYKQGQAGETHSQLKISEVPARCVTVRTDLQTAAAFISKQPFQPQWNMYNGYDEGGDLIWSLPGRKVSIDGRADVYFGDVFDDYMRLNRLSYDWKAVLAKYPVDFIVTSASSGLTKLAMTSKDWALVYATYPDFDSPVKTPGGENVLIFVKRDTAHAPYIAEIRKSCPTIMGAPFKARYSSYPAIH